MINVLRGFIITLVTAAAVTACTKADPNRIAFESPFKFTYDGTFAKGENIASADGEGVTSSQLFSPSPALQELEMRIQKIYLEMAYDKAVTAAGDEKATLTMGFAAPKDDVKKLLGTKYKSAVDVQFDESLGQDTYKINDTTHKTTEFESSNRLLAQLRNDSFTQKMQALEGIVARRKVLEAAKAANTPMEEFIQKQILANPPPITDEETKAYAKKNNISEAELTPELHAQLKDILKGRQRDRMITEYVAKNLLKTPVRVGFAKPAIKIDLPPVGEAAPHKGQGPIEITLFSYLQCQDCKSLTKTMSDFVENNPKYYKLNYVFNFQESNNEERMVSEAGMCLRKQNENYFWIFSQVLVKSDAGIEEAVNNAAKATGADFEAFRACFLAREFKDAVNSHVLGTKTLGFHRSPVVVIEGSVYEVPDATALMDKAQELKAEKGLGFNLFYKIKKALFGS